MEQDENMTHAKWISLSLALALLSNLPTAMAQNSQRTAAGVYFASDLPQLAHRRNARPQRDTPSIHSGQIQKPFRNLAQQPSVSPYLSLDIATAGGDTGLPNYYAFYKPQQDQRQLVQSQQAEIQKLQQRVNAAQVGNRLARNPREGMPTTGNSSQFMNLGNYYPSLR